MRWLEGLMGGEQSVAEVWRGREKSGICETRNGRDDNFLNV